jgi:hypothetical protein
LAETATGNATGIVAKPAETRALAQDWIVTSQLLLKSVKCDFSHSGRPASVSSFLALQSH